MSMSVSLERRLLRFLAAVAAGGLLLGVASSASAANQGGRNTLSSSDLNGNYAVLTATGAFNPNSGTCVLISVLAYDQTADKQLEVGAARCNNQTIDGSCTSGHRFVEQYLGDNVYHCHEHAGFSNFVDMTYWVDRPSSSSGTFTAHIDSNTWESQSGFTPGTNVQGYVWMERTGSSTSCSGWGPATASVNYWQKTVGVDNWTYATGPRYDPTNCFSISNVSSIGSFDVAKSS